METTAAMPLEADLEPTTTAIDAVFERLLADIVKGVLVAG
ncbi:MAG: hypothetical protein H6R20_1744, partial [Proteobacteria bacterium]|nr:hypothetical protein [Pseudomonadota bacterium]